MPPLLDLHGRELRDTAVREGESRQSNDQTPEKRPEASVPERIRHRVPGHLRRHHYAADEANQTPGREGSSGLLDQSHSMHLSAVFRCTSKRMMAIGAVAFRFSGGGFQS